jgi:hypothetical protein
MQSGSGDIIEFLLIEVRLSLRNLLLGVIYNQPPSNNEIRLLKDILVDFVMRCNDIIICGDLNINLLKNTSECRRLKSLLNNNSLQYLKLDPTCHSPISHVSSLIDYIIVGNTNRVITHRQVPIPGVSEHDLVFLQLSG